MESVTSICWQDMTDSSITQRSEGQPSQKVYVLQHHSVLGEAAEPTAAGNRSPLTTVKMNCVIVLYVSFKGNTVLRK